MIKKILLVQFVLSVIVFGLSTNANACVASSFTVDDYSPDVNADVTVTYSLPSGFSKAETWAWNFGEDAVPATANTEGPHVIHYTTEGQKTIRLDVTTLTNSASSSRTLNAMPVVPISIASSLFAMLVIGGSIFFKRKRVVS